MSNEAELPTIFVDFNNADAEGFVRLNNIGTTDDLLRFKVKLTDGLRLRASDGEIVVEGSVHTPGSEGVWRLQVDWDEVFRKHAHLS